MKKLLITLGLFSNMPGFAQEKINQLSEQIGFTSSTTAAYNINGNDTTLANAFTIAPYLRIIHKSGLGLNYSLHSLVSGNRDKLYMHTAAAFYEEYGKPLNLNFSYTHFFFTKNAAIPYTPISNELYGFVSYKKLWLAPAVATSIGFGKDEKNQIQSSINIAAGVTHSFSIKSETVDEAEISPSIFLNGSSNKLYSFLRTSKYLNQNAGSKGFLNNHGRKHGNGNGGSGTNTATPSTTNNFTLNNVELSLYSSFTIGHFEIVPDGSLFVPLNADNGFSAYWQLKLGYNFGK